MATEQKPNQPSDGEVVYRRVVPPAPGTKKEGRIDPKLLPLVAGFALLHNLEEGLTAMPPYWVVTVAEDPSLVKLWNDIEAEAFQEYNDHGDVLGDDWHRLVEVFDDYQFVLFEGVEPVGLGQTIPFVWDGTVEDLGEAEVTSPERPVDVVVLGHPLIGRRHVVKEVGGPPRDHQDRRAA